MTAKNEPILEFYAPQISKIRTKNLFLYPFF